MAQADPNLRVKNRIRTVLESLDANNAKKTAKLCKDLEQEFPKSNLVKGAVALVHAKQHKFPESVGLLEALSKNAPEWILDRYMHWLVLSAIKVTERFDLAEKMYESAWTLFKSKPNSAQEDLIWIGQSLFGAYVRSNNASKQRLHAMSMWKDLKSEQYYFWSIVAMVTPLPDSDKMLAIAERMIETWYEQGKIQSQEQVEYYVHVLAKQNKNKEALDVLRSEAAKSAFNIPSQLHDHEARLLVSLEKYGEARDIYRRLLTEVNSDEWSWYIGYFDNLFKVGFADGDMLNSRSEVSQLLSQLQVKTISDRTKYRGPFLAGLEYSKRLFALGLEKEIPISLFAEYFQHFGGKSCFFRDIAPYLALLDADAARNVLSGIHSTLGAFDSSAKQSDQIDWSYRLASVEAVRRSLHATPSPLETSTFLLKQYQETRHWNVKKEVTERMCGDDLALLAAHYALDNRSSVSGLFDAAAIIEYAIGASKYNFQFRLLLLRIYSAIGAAKGALKQVEELDIKQIQLDSMGYLILETLSSQMQFQELVALAKRTRHFHDDNRKNTNDFILEAYKNNRYSKVKEIGDFQYRLQSSLQLVVAKVAQTFGQLVIEASSLDSCKEILNALFSTASFETVPLTEGETLALRDNADTDVEDSFDLDRVRRNLPWSEDIATSHACKTSAFRDEHQRSRLLFEIHALNMLRITSGVQATAKQLSSEEAATFNRSMELAKSLLERLPASSPTEKASLSLLLQSLEASLLLMKFSSALAEDNPHDWGTVLENVQRSLKTFIETLSSTWSSIVDELSFFLSRAAIPCFILLSVWGQVFPARPRAKASDTQKAGHSDIRESLRHVLKFMKEIFLRYEQFGTKDVALLSSELDLLQPSALPTFSSLGLSSLDAKRVVDHVRETTTGSLKDSLVNFALAVKDKLRELNTLKF